MSKIEEIKKKLPLKKIICPHCGEEKRIRKGLRTYEDGAKVRVYQCESCTFTFTPEKAKEAQIGKKHQTGKTTVRVDKGRPAKPPGIRTTEWGTKYPEYRRNRSDVSKAGRL